MKNKPVSIASVADEIMNHVSQQEQTKVAAAKAASAVPPSDLGKLFHKLAADLRQEPTDVTFDDLRQYVKEAGLRR